MNKPIQLLLLLVCLAGAAVATLRLFDLFDADNKFFWSVQTLGYLAFLLFMYLQWSQQRMEEK